MPAADVAAWQAQWSPAELWSVWNDPLHVEKNRIAVIEAIKRQHGKDAL
jgi:hypothetical protein